MKVYVFLDEDNFCTGWGSNKEENSIELEIKDESILAGIRKYKYINGQIIYDETKALIEAKESKEVKATKKYEENMIKGVAITILGMDLVYPYDDERKDYLNKSYELSKDNLISEAYFTFKNGNDDIALNLSKVNIYELWLLSFIHEEKCKKELFATKSLINHAQSLKEIQEIKI